MCGIVGYVGPRDAGSIVFEGLRRLEYRGYDSAGLAVCNGGALELRRSSGKLDNLQRVLAEKPTSGNIGIGHTRWATHGRPSEQNAHPHIDCEGDIVVIHNGMVENYLSLKQRLQSAGHGFRSETDTEVIAHLVEDKLAVGLGLPEAVRVTLSELKGNHAIIVMSRVDPSRLVTARIGNAGGIVIGWGEEEMFVASDMPAVLEHTQRMSFLEDSEIGVIDREGARYLRLDGTPVEKEVHSIAHDPVSAAKGSYKHFTLKEIVEQPRALSDCVSTRLNLDAGDVHLEELRFTDEQIRDLSRIVLVGSGSAWHACLVGKFLFENFARLPVEVDYAGEFRYRQPVMGPDDLFIAMTQSGETVDTLVSMDLARQLGSLTLGMVNVVGSQASRVSDSVVYLHAGPEIGVASTKAFTNMLVALYLLALKFGRVRGTIDSDQVRARLQALTEVPAQVSRLLDDHGVYEELANLYFKRRDFLYVARGINYPIALEGALKLKEISYIHAEGYPGGELKHGPIALVDDEIPIVAILARDRVHDKIMSNVEQAKARGGVVIAIGPEGDRDLAGKVDHLIEVPATDEMLSPLINTIPMQLISYYLAVRRGCDVDQPRNLAKSVTVE